jgi:hypothetical protein
MFYLSMKGPSYILSFSSTDTTIDDLRASLLPPNPTDIDSTPSPPTTPTEQTQSVKKTHTL